MYVLDIVGKTLRKLMAHYNLIPLQISRVPINGSFLYKMLTIMMVF